MPLNGKTSKRISAAAIRRRNVWALFRAGLPKYEIAEHPGVACSRQHVYKIIKAELDKIEKDTVADVKAVFQRDLAVLDDMQAKVYRSAFGDCQLDEDGEPVKADEKTLGMIEAVKTIVDTIMNRRAKMLGYDGVMTGEGTEDKALVVSFTYGEPAEPPKT